MTTPIEPPVVADDSELAWQREMFREARAGTVHAFILHFNIDDFVFTPTIAEKGRPRFLRDYLADLAAVNKFRAVIYYARGVGLRWLYPAMEKLARERYNFEECSKLREYGQGGEPGNRISPPSEAAVALHFLYRLLSAKPKDPTAGKNGGKGQPAKEDPFPIMVILEDLDTLAPANNQPDAQLNTQILQRLFADRQVRRNGHMVIGLTRDLGRLSPEIYSAAAECRHYRIDLPTEELQAVDGRPPRRDRSLWLRYQLKRAAEAGRVNPLTLPGGAGSEEVVAAQTSGFSYDNLADLIRYTSQAELPLSIDLIRTRKRDVIQAQSGNLLEVVEPRYGLDAIAGYDYVKRYLGVIRQVICEQGKNSALGAIVPKGILFLGPPGTGKSFAASCLAQATGFNMVKLKNIRSMWVGETERNLNSVLDLLRAMHPVIVFVDELDAAMGTRESAGEGGGGGVERRVFQRLLEFMAMDENRGAVLWIGASNRPDAIDAALISRFDMVIPFLLPNAEARRQMITGTFGKTIGYHLETKPADVLEDFIERTDGFSGRELDTVCRRALQVACLAPGAAVQDDGKPIVPAKCLLDALADFRQARDPLMYQLQTLLAIQATNFRSFLPTRDEIPEAVRADENAPYPLDEEKLQEEIQRLRHMTSVRFRGVAV